MMRYTKKELEEESLWWHGKGLKTASAIAGRLGISQTHVARRMRALGLGCQAKWAPVWKAVAAGERNILVLSELSDLDPRRIYQHLHPKGYELTGKRGYTRRVKGEGASGAAKAYGKGGGGAGADTIAPVAVTTNSSRNASSGASQ